MAIERQRLITNGAGRSRRCPKYQQGLTLISWGVGGWWWRLGVFDMSSEDPATYGASVPRFGIKPALNPREMIDPFHSIRPSKVCESNDGYSVDEFVSVRTGMDYTSKYLSLFLKHCDVCSSLLSLRILYRIFFIFILREKDGHGIFFHYCAKSTIVPM